MQKKKWNIWTILSLLFFIGCILISAYTTRRAAAMLLSSDSSSELVLARHLADKGALISSDWFYSTELRVLNTQLVFMPLFKITNDWSTVRFIGALILQGILVISYWFLTRSLKIRLRYFLITAGLLILPFSGEYALIVLYHCYYVPHISIGFILLGLFCRLQSRASRKNWKNVCLLIVYLLLSFCSGLGGVRQLMVTFAPLMLITFVLCFRPQQKNTACSLKERMRLFITSKDGVAFAVSFMGTLCAGVGYLVNNNVLSQYFSFFSYGGINLSMPAFATFEECIAGLLCFFGFREGVPLLSISGIVSVCSIFCFCLAIYFSIRFCLRRYQIDSIPIAVICLMFLSALVINLSIFLLSKNYSHRYLTPVIALFIPFLALLLDHQTFSLPAPRQTSVLSIFIVVIMAANSFYFARPYLKRSLTPEKADNAPDISQATDYLEENGYTFGYATYWDANIITELTDGQIEMVNVIDLPTPRFYRWLTLKDYENPDYHEGKTFLLLTLKEEEEIIDSALLANGKKVYEDHRYVIYDYPSSEKFFETQDDSASE